MVVVRPDDSLDYDVYPEGVVVEVLSEDGVLLTQTTTGAVGQYAADIEGVGPGDKLRVRAVYNNGEIELRAVKRVAVNNNRFALVPDLVFAEPTGSELVHDGTSWVDRVGDVEIIVWVTLKLSIRHVAFLKFGHGLLTQNSTALSFRATTATPMGTKSSLTAFCL
ncbi:hypothetical protein ODE01S_00400 [Oceanithermus desulfurans NBRC 100063]|uniref:Uncharacterized protein n=1 Tax=Oceanithermus desulfurans NBRC 100063 TaxID=1227550 RepID=A0A511RID7_9DEIN|nr:hypothetical protein ODE01S_00400 [Oceanithermus desulfurans NBRC 100063]